MPFDYHPDYGLTDELRIRAIVDAERLGTSEAARLHRLHPTTICRWRRRAAELASSHGDAANG
jgi:transposase-like protein